MISISENAQNVPYFFRQLIGAAYAKPKWFSESLNLMLGLLSVLCYDSIPPNKAMLQL